MVHEPPRYARFRCPDGDETLSIEVTGEAPVPPRRARTAVIRHGDAGSSRTAPRWRRSFRSGSRSWAGRLPAPLLSDLKALANKRDVPYQSLLKVFVADRVAEEWRLSKYRGAMTDKVLQPTNRTRSKAKVTRATRAVRG